ncbi:MAG TPA: nucleotide exchange factor GrpE [Bacteroidia bacterium]|nr:nucleotide exchange factor GrpE [Sphingobacteriales bacterium]HPD65207.1 nucleotide exchange factor GrpE [Bacteroidia bacterium]HRS58586.1 nucleotide exchange factor GrpE [Bacteroidia bacterium]HRU68047.1 nucleotide exchange factor GrpE [Bacteroidia bacterium]
MQTEEKQQDKIIEENNEAVKETSTEEEKLTEGQESNEKKEEEEINKLKTELAELQDKYLRLYSEFENYRRRTNKEKLDLIDYASERIILELLPVIDDFERAQQVMNENTEKDSVNNGINLIINKLKKILTDQGLEEIKCLEKEFNPDFHEAITKVAAPSKKLKGKIIDQVQKGYLLKGKVIRHSKVVVGE